MNDWTPPILGYAFSVIVGHLCIAAVVDCLYAGVGSEGKNRQANYFPGLVGVLERVLFVASLQMGKAEFIGLWFALKVAGGWKRWGEGIELGGVKIDGRSLYNIFLIGNGLSIAYAVVGAQLINSLAGGNWSFSIGLPGALLAGTLALYILIGYYQKQSKSSGA